MINFGQKVTIGVLADQAGGALGGYDKRMTFSSMGVLARANINHNIRALHKVNFPLYKLCQQQIFSLNRLVRVLAMRLK